MAAASSSPGERERDWRDLPDELIGLIWKKLPDLRDFIRFRATCPAWRSSAPLSDPPPQLPWLLQTPTETETGLGEELRFYSLASGETGVIHVEQSHWGKFYSGPCCGYLFLYLPICLGGEAAAAMYNPLTNSTISLPAFPDHPVRNIWPVWTGSDPIDSRCIVFADTNPFFKDFEAINYWAVHPPDDSELILVTKGYFHSCYRDGKLVATKPCERSRIYCSPGKTEFIACRDDEAEDGTLPQVYLIQLTSGVIIEVCHYCEDSIFDIYEFDEEEENGEQHYWVQVSDIGDNILFLDENNGFALKSAAGFKGNSIYFFNHQDGTPSRYDIASRTFERVPCPFKASTWFVPSLL